MHQFPAILTEKEWYAIKDIVYYEDGSLRDIYILQTNLHDWSKWIDLVNEKYNVEFYNGLNDITEPSINKEIVLDYLNGKRGIPCFATLKLENINIKIYFFTDTEIENDICPKEIKSFQSHNLLIQYLIDVSQTLSKPVYLTPETMQNITGMKPNIVYIEVHGNSVKINTDVDYSLR